MQSCGEMKAGIVPSSRAGWDQSSLGSIPACERVQTRKDAMRAQRCRRLTSEQSSHKIIMLYS
jgi:hypothetical protein